MLKPTAVIAGGAFRAMEDEGESSAGESLPSTPAPKPLVARPPARSAARRFLPLAIILVAVAVGIGFAVYARSGAPGGPSNAASTGWIRACVAFSGANQTRWILGVDGLTIRNQSIAWNETQCAVDEASIGSHIVEVSCNTTVLYQGTVQIGDGTITDLPPNASSYDCS